MHPCSDAMQIHGQPCRPSQATRPALRDASIAPGESPWRDLLVQVVRPPPASRLESPPSAAGCRRTCGVSCRLLSCALDWRRWFSCLHASSLTVPFRSFGVKKSRIQVARMLGRHRAAGPRWGSGVLCMPATTRSDGCWVQDRPAWRGGKIGSADVSSGSNRVAASATRWDAAAGREMSTRKRSPLVNERFPASPHTAPAPPSPTLPASPGCAPGARSPSSR